MLVLHAFWDPSVGAGVWAEDSELTVTGRSEALRRARPHPLAASAEALAALLEDTTATATTVLPLSLIHI